MRTSSLIEGDERCVEACVYLYVSDYEDHLQTCSKTGEEDVVFETSLPKLNCRDVIEYSSAKSFHLLIFGRYQALFGRRQL